VWRVAGEKVLMFFFFGQKTPKSALGEPQQPTAGILGRSAAACRVRGTVNDVVSIGF